METLETLLTQAATPLLSQYNTVQGIPELEIRIFNVNATQFDRVLHFNRRKFEPVYTEESCLIIPNGDRYLLESRTIQRKVTHAKSDLTEYALRIALSSEFTEPMIGDPSIFLASQPITTRRKRRWSFTVNEFFRLDMTIAETGPNTTYEIELEALKLPTPQYLVKATCSILQYLQNSFYILPISVLNTIAQQLPRTLKGAQPRTLQQFHLDTLRKQPFAITVKLDGYRAYLLVVGPYLILQTQEWRVIRIMDSLREWSGTIIEGELVNAGEKDESFHAFDLLSCKGVSVRGNCDFPLNRRMEQIQAFSTALPPDFIVIKEYYSDINKATDMLTQSKLPVDGLIFVPVDEPYSQTSKWEHLYKWKSEVTIDLRYRNKQWWVNATPNEIPFKPFAEPQAGNADHVSGLVEGSIWECRWNMDESRFIPIRNRTDKSVPNFLNVALDNMYAILNPLTIGELTGEEYLVNTSKPEAYEFYADGIVTCDKWFDIIIREHKAVQNAKTLMDWLSTVKNTNTTAPPVRPATPPQTPPTLESSKPPFEKMKVADAKMYLQTHGLSVKGKKKELLDRVHEHMSKK